MRDVASESVAEPEMRVGVVRFQRDRFLEVRLCLFHVVLRKRDFAEDEERVGVVLHWGEDLLRFFETSFFEERGTLLHLREDRQRE